MIVSFSLNNDNCERAEPALLKKLTYELIYT